MATTPSTATDFAYSGTELDALAAAPNYYRHIVRRFAPHLGTRCVEVGAGIGTFSEHLLRETTVRELVAVEPADNNFPTLEQRFGARPGVRLLHGYLESFPDVRDMDSVVAVNVLEHTPDDVAFLKAAKATLKPGGAVCLFVPAVQAIFGSLDHEFEHYRRYDKTTLGRAFADAGFGNVRMHWVNSVGILSWFLVGRVLKARTIGVNAVRVYDNMVIPWLLPLEQAVEPPIGQSLLAIARV